jgi:hypothetical protein
MEIELPDLSDQKLLLGRLSELNALRAMHRAHLQLEDHLFASLQQRAFRDELQQKPLAA